MCTFAPELHKAPGQKFSGSQSSRPLWDLRCGMKNCVENFDFRPTCAFILPFFNHGGTFYLAWCGLLDANRFLFCYLPDSPTLFYDVCQVCLSVSLVVRGMLSLSAICFFLCEIIVSWARSVRHPSGFRCATQGVDADRRTLVSYFLSSLGSST